MSISFPTQGHYVVYMHPDIIFQILLPCSRPMTSHHMTAVSYASSLSKRKIKEKEKENQYKIRKINEKWKSLVFKHPITRSKCIAIVSGAVHTVVEVCRMDSEMSRLVEWPWLQLMCCAICLPHGRNFRWRREVRVGVSADWCVAIEHQRSSSIRVYLRRLSD